MGRDSSVCIRGPPTLLYNGYRGSFLGGKATGAWSWRLTSNYCRGQEWVELYLHSPNTYSRRGAQLNTDNTAINLLNRFSAIYKHFVSCGVNYFSSSEWKYRNQWNESEKWTKKMRELQTTLLCSMNELVVFQTPVGGPCNRQNAKCVGILHNNTYHNCYCCYIDYIWEGRRSTQWMRIFSFHQCNKSIMTRECRYRTVQQYEHQNH